MHRFGSFAAAFSGIAAVLTYFGLKRGVAVGLGMLLALGKFARIPPSPTTDGHSHA